MLNVFTDEIKCPIKTHKAHTCLLSETNCVSSCRIVSTPASWEAERDVMSLCSKCMPLGGLRRALSGWWRYWAPMLSFFTGPERLGVAWSALVLVGLCFTACMDTAHTQILETYFRLRHFYNSSNKKNTFMYYRCSSNWGTLLALIWRGWSPQASQTTKKHKNEFREEYTRCLTSFFAAISKSLSLPGSASSRSSLLQEQKTCYALCPGFQNDF